MSRIRGQLATTSLAAAMLVTGVGLATTTGKGTNTRSDSALTSYPRLMPVLHQRFRTDHVANTTRATPSSRRSPTLTPLVSYRITARFGQGGGRWARNHTGLDFAAPTGTTVRAVRGGTIISAGWAGAYGNQIRIRHAGGIESWYCHLSSVRLRSGLMPAGAVIGAVGSTGNSTGPHLHLEIRQHGRPIDPMPWLRLHGARL